MNALNDQFESASTLRVRVKNGGGYNQFDTARLQISVGQRYHEGEEFKATIDWAKQHFQKVIVCVNDLLQRHNHKLSVGEEAAEIIAEAEGRHWIERNIGQIRRLPDFEILRWQAWLDHPDFNKELENARASYYQDPIQVLLL